MTTLERLWRKRDLWCMVVLTDMGFRCGYVGIPQDHPWHERHYDDIPAHPHGGMTFAGRMKADLFDEHDGIPDEWWVGFDCAHAGDAPEPDRWNKVTAGLAPSVWADGGHLWTTDEVASEVERLADAASVANLLRELAGP